MPQSRWVLSSLVKDDAASALAGDRGLHSYRESYGYEDGYYDRSERMFYGFASVLTTRGSGSVTKTSYANDDYYTRSMPTGTELRSYNPGGQGELYQTSAKTIEPHPVTTAIRPSTRREIAIKNPRVLVETKRQYQPGTAAYVETKTEYGYEDDYGNVEEIYDYGTTGDSGATLHAVIAYDFAIPGGAYLKQHPTSIKVTDGSGKLLRWREGGYGSCGELLSLTEYSGSSQSSGRTSSLGYDRYGNLASITDPRGYRIGWTYDDTAHSYVTLISAGNSAMASPTYESSMSWNYSLGKKTSETDENGATMRYVYDDFGRLSEVWSPYDGGSTPAVLHSFDHSGFPWTATTANKLLHAAGDSTSILTMISVDGLGRVAQTAKEGEYRDAGGTRHDGWNLSGAVAYDDCGRAVSEGQPQFAEGDGAPALAPMAKATTSSYDAQDRVVGKALPDGSTMSIAYQVSGNRLVELSTDPLGNSTRKTLDGRGNITGIARLSSAGATLMSASYGYDAFSQMLSAVDSQGNAVSAAYDLSGRQTSLSSPDTGTVLMTYDAAGNLAAKSTSVLRSMGQSITYQYDGLERLVRVQYPTTTATVYTYGDSGAPDGGAARLVKRSDASGSVQYKYGLLGETIAMTRTIDRLRPAAEDETASFAYESDYLGRMQKITYPDGEVVSYGYDGGGQIQSAVGVHDGLSIQYVKDIAYDAFGQRTYIEYGNGVRTSYAYDENRRWLDAIKTSSAGGTVYQAMAYRFDLVGNVLGYANDAGSYATSQEYGYDGLYQLTSARGTNEYRPYGITEYTSSYNQKYAYDEIGNMTSKTSSSATNSGSKLGDDLNYSYAYSYYAGKAHQAEKIGNLYYRYDGNGNMVEERAGGHGTSTVLAGNVYSSGDLRMTDTGFGLVRTSGGSTSETYTRYYAWDEENRLVRSVDKSVAVDYRYGADNQRSAKYTKNGESLYFDAMWAAQTDGSGLRRMKNVYVGQTRIATKLSLDGVSGTGYEKANTYYYHPDHLGSAQLVTDYEGQEYERIEYTPYGESWIEKTSDGLELLPYKFTGKELDSETGLYYYGARYLNPKTSAWLSADPALGEYIPTAPIDEEARKRNGNLPGMGGVYNLVNLALYHYAGNNPVKYTDPDGKFVPGLAVYGLAVGAVAVGTAVVAGVAAVIGIISQKITDDRVIKAGNELNAAKDAAPQTGVGSTKTPAAIPEPEASSSGAGAIKGPPGERLTASGNIKLPFDVPVFTKEMLSNSRVIAQGDKIREVGRLVEQYGGKARDWKKMSVTDANGQEWHYYQNPNVGKVEIKPKDPTE